MHIYITKQKKMTKIVRYCHNLVLLLYSFIITPTVVGVYRDWPGSSSHQTCTFDICNFRFHYGSNVTSSGIQVKSMQNVNCTLKIVGKYYIRCVLYAKMHFTNCSSSSSSSCSG